MSDPIMEATQMDGQPAEAQALKAIRHALNRIGEVAAVGWHCGAGTQMFALLTEALATLTSQPVKQVREKYIPRNVADPSGPEWIAISQEPPSRYQTVLIANNDWSDPIRFGYFDGNVYCDIRGFTSEPQPTHWMELPEPPESEVAE